MKRFAAIVSIALAASLLAAPSRLDVARRALGDGLWSVAVNHAEAVAAATTNAAVIASARLIELEALAGAKKPAEMLAKLDAWTDASAEGFRYWRAWANFERGRLDVARHILSADFKSPGFAVLALRLSARAAVAASDRAAAMSLFAKASSALSADADAHTENAVEWARALEHFNDRGGALTVLERERATVAKGPAGDAARLLAAELSAEAGDAATSRRLFEMLVAGGTNTEERAYVLASCGLVDVYLAAGMTNNALRAASNAVARAARPELMRRAGFTLGFTLLSQPSTRTNGYAVVSSLIRRFPGEVESGRAQLRLADTLLAVGDAAAAAHEYDVLLQAYPEHTLDVHVLEGRGLAFVRLGRQAEAVGMFARAAQVATNDVVRTRCIFEQAEALRADGRFAEAAMAYGAIVEGELRPQARLRQAESLLRAERPQEAERLFRALVKEGGEPAVEASLRIASLEVARGHFEQAIADYGSVLAEKSGLMPTPEQRVRALSGRGRALYRAYRFREAEADFVTVAKLCPDRRDEMGFLSVLCLYGDGRDGEAYAAANALLASVTDSRLKCDLHFWLAKYDAGRREFARAIDGFEACATNEHATSTRRLDSIVRAARCASALSDFPRVVELAGRAVSNAIPVETSMKATPETPYVAEALVLQGEALKELARFDKALYVFDIASRMPVSDALRRRAVVSRADCLFAMGADDAKCYHRALEVYHGLRQDEKLSPSLRLAISYKIGRTYEKLRRFEEAAEELYTHVVLTYWNGVRSDRPEDAARRVWFDGNSRVIFARAVFNLADYYESRGEVFQAIKVLEYLNAARVPSASEAKRRIARLKEKGNFR